MEILNFQTKVDNCRKKKSRKKTLDFLFKTDFKFVFLYTYIKYKNKWKRF